MKKASNKRNARPGGVVVVGSLNIDYIASVRELPKPGETVRATRLGQLFGGKGANQATAAARQGVRVEMIGCVGADDHGSAYLKRLEREGIGTEQLRRVRGCLTGTALIAVDRAGENHIIVAEGANGRVTADQVRSARGVLAGAGALLVQFEVPAEAVVEAARQGNRAGVPVIVNPSPMRVGFPWGRVKVDSLIVNEGEARRLLGRLDGGVFRKLRRMKTERLLVTRGARPTVVFAEGECWEVPTLKVKPVDTVGAGDAFAGVYAAARARGMVLRDAVRWANTAGALATLKPGAQEAMPTREMILRRLVK